MRVIAGQFRSRPLRSLPGQDTRPTSDRLRETLFDILTAGNPDSLRGTAWLDLFAGTGAVGIEALSRGAAVAHFVESSKRAAQVIRDNLESLGIRSGFEVQVEEVRRALRLLAPTQFDYVFLDPPYRMAGAYHESLRGLAQEPLLREGAIVIAEHDKRFDPGDGVENLCRYRTLQQGDAGLSFYRIG